MLRASLQDVRGQQFLSTALTWAISDSTMQSMQVSIGDDWRSVERWQKDLMRMLNEMRGPGRGVEIGKNIRFWLRKGKTRKEAEKQLALERPMLAAAQMLHRNRRDLAIIRYRDSEVLCFKVDLQMSVSNMMISNMEQTGQLRAESGIIVPGVRGADKPTEEA